MNKKVLRIGLIVGLVVLATAYGVYKYANNPTRKLAREAAAKKAVIDGYVKSSAQFDEITAALNGKSYDKVISLSLSYLDNKDNLYINRLNVGVACMQAAEALKKNDVKKDCYEKAKNVLSEVTLESDKKDWEKYLKEVYENLPQTVEEGSDDGLPS